MLKKTSQIIENNIIDLPEILIIFLDVPKNCDIKNDKEFKLINNKYNLICFISNKNEKNQIEEQIIFFILKIEIGLYIK